MEKYGNKNKIIGIDIEDVVINMLDIYLDKCYESKDIDSMITISDFIENNIFGIDCGKLLNCYYSHLEKLILSAKII